MALIVFMEQIYLFTYLSLFVSSSVHLSLPLSLSSSLSFSLGIYLNSNGVWGGIKGFITFKSVLVQKWI